MPETGLPHRETDRLGGHVARFDLTFPHLSSAKQMIRPIIQRVENHPNIEVFKQSVIRNVSGYIGNFKALVHNGKPEPLELKVRKHHRCTGLKPFDPSKIEEYGYGKFPDVVTSMEFEEMLSAGKVLTKYGKEPRNIAIIHCVGSRSKVYHEYCSAPAAWSP
jgi:heterodisulfide reductase subunit A-like polyferredoxin